MKSVLKALKCYLTTAPRVERDPQRPAPSPQAFSVVFSVLFNESDSFLDSFVRNFLTYTDEDMALVVNYPVGRPLPKLKEAASRIFVVNGETPRGKVGHTLLVGHLESYDFAMKAFGGFDYFCTLASNSLLVRRFDLDIVRNQLDAVVRRGFTAVTENPPDNWWWPKFRNNPELVAFIRDAWGLEKLSQGQIEGLTAARTDWNTLYERFDDIKSLGQYMLPQYLVPLEEVLPHTFINAFGSGRYINTIHLYWDRGHNGRVVPKDLVMLDQEHPPQIFGLKWFEREPSAPETMAVSEPWACELISRLNSLLAEGDAAALLTYRDILLSLSDGIAARTAYRPISSHWPGEPDAAWNWSFSDLTAQRQYLPLHFASGHGDAGSVLLENTGEEFQLDIRARQDQNSTEITVESKPLNGAQNDIVQGYVYLNPGSTPGSIVFGVRIPAEADPRSLPLMDRIVIFSDKRYRVAKPDTKCVMDEVHEYTYHVVAENRDAPTLIGLPFTASCRLTCAISASSFA